MKKFLTILICGVMFTSSLTACINNDSTGSSASGSSSKSSSSEKSSSSGSSSAAGSSSSKSDATTSASPKESSDPEAIAKGLSKDGYWIFAVLSDVTLTKDLSVDGEFHDKGEAGNKIYRKLALYAQDADHKVTEEYTLTVPKITVTSPSFRIQNGTVKGDVYVDADGFELSKSKIDGNLYFKTQEQKDSALLTEGTVTGETKVGY